MKKIIKISGSLLLAGILLYTLFYFYPGLYVKYLLNKSEAKNIYATTAKYEPNPALATNSGQAVKINTLEFKSPWNGSPERSAGDSTVFLNLKYPNGNKLLVSDYGDEPDVDTLVVFQEPQINNLVKNQFPNISSNINFYETIYSLTPQNITIASPRNKVAAIFSLLEAKSLTTHTTDIKAYIGLNYIVFVHREDELVTIEIVTNKDRVYRILSSNLKTQTEIDSILSTIKIN